MGWRERGVMGYVISNKISRWANCDRDMGSNRIRRGSLWTGIGKGYEMESSSLAVLFFFLMDDIDIV